MRETYHTSTQEETRARGASFGATLAPATLVCFYGDLGAGKTTFIQGMLGVFGAEGPFVSPTFVLMKEYLLKMPTATGIRRVYHADAYRIESAEDFEKIGFGEWIDDPSGVVLLEWPERVSDSLPERYMRVSIRLIEGESREIIIESFQGERV